MTNFDGENTPPAGCDDFPVWHPKGYMRCKCGATATAPTVAAQQITSENHYKAVRQLEAR